MAVVWKNSFRWKKRISSSQKLSNHWEWILSEKVAPCFSFVCFLHSFALWCMMKERERETQKEVDLQLRNKRGWKSRDLFLSFSGVSGAVILFRVRSSSTMVCTSLNKKVWLNRGTCCLRKNQTHTHTNTRKPCECIQCNLKLCIACANGDMQTNKYNSRPSNCRVSRESVLM